jgi:solute carrier family 25 oxoglutarate transporter 11
VAGLGGASGWLFIHPMDVLKVRMQINEHAGGRLTARSAVSGIVGKEGFRGLYSGLSAAMARQLSYTTTRIGLYDVFREMAAPGSAGAGAPAPSVMTKMLCGISAGAIAATLCCPVEVALVRMQADGAADPALRRGYRNVVHAIATVAKDEGLSVLWRGVRPTVARGMIVSMTQLATYDQAKESLQATGVFAPGFNVKLNLAASICSGFVYCAASLPMDITKTRMQNQRPLADGTMAYRSIPQTILAVARNESVFALWKGFGPYFARGGGHTVTMFFFVEQYKRLLEKVYRSD